MSHPHTFQVMKPKPGTSTILHNPGIDYIKDRRVLDTLLVIQESQNLNARYIGISFSHPHTFPVMHPQSGTSSVVDNFRNQDIRDN